MFFNKNHKFIELNQTLYTILLVFILHMTINSDNIVTKEGLTMKILIISDTHNFSKENLIQYINEINAEHVIHCGDIYALHKPGDIENSTVVRGNNDNYNCPLDTTVALDNDRFYICHGHKHSIHISTNKLVSIAKNQNCNIVCYGHSHIPHLEIVEDILIINPGSLVYPRGYYNHGSYCVFDTTTKQTTFYNSDTQKSFNINKN